MMKTLGILLVMVGIWHAGSAFRLRNCVRLQPQYDAIRSEFKHTSFKMEKDIQKFKTVFLDNMDRTQTYVCHFKKSLEQVKAILEDTEGGPGINGNAIRLKWIAILNTIIANYAPYCHSYLHSKSAELTSSIDSMWSVVDRVKNYDRWIQANLDSDCDFWEDEFAKYDDDMLGFKDSYYDKYNRFLNLIGGGALLSSPFRGRCLGGYCGGPQYQPYQPYQPYSSYPQYPPMYPPMYPPQQSYGGYGGGAPVTSIREALVNTAPSTQSVNGLLAAGLNNVYNSNSKLVSIL